MRITICGGGNLGHVCAGFFGAQDDMHVSMLTTHPEQWSQYLDVVDANGKTLRGKLDIISSDPKIVIPNADIVLVCLPGFAIHDTLTKIESALDVKTWVGTVVSSTGFFFEAMKILPKNQPLFGFQRVPFISRVITYGHTAELKGYKESLSVAVEQTDQKEIIRSKLEQLFKTPVKLLKSYYEVSLSNSNPLLHTARLYTMFKDWEAGMSYKRNPGFYSEWTIEASELYISMDNEFQLLLDKIGVNKGSIPPVLKYYESKDAESLTQKIKSIQAFQGINSPMKRNQQGLYVPDFTSRYFTEDYSYGMRFIVETANKYNTPLTYIAKVYSWGMEKLERSER